MPPKKKTRVDDKQRSLTDLFTLTKKKSVIESESTIQPTTSSHESGVSVPVPESETVVVEDATHDSGKKRTEIRFQTAWKDSFPWLRFEAESDMMYCSACIEAKVVKNSFTVGCKNIRKSAITDHLLTADHQLALQVPVQVQNQQMCSALSLSKQEKGMTQVAKAAHFIVEQYISFHADL